MSNKGKLAEALKHMGVRNDANETAVIERELEFVSQQTYDIKYPNLRGKDFCPINMSIPEGAEFFKYLQWDRTGLAEFLANGAGDIALVDASKQEFAHRMKRLAIAYQYTKDDLIQAQQFGTKLDTSRAMAARRGMENKIDQLIALGDDKQGYKGMVNHPDVTVLTAPGSWSVGGRTPLEILDDLHTLCNEIDNIEDGFMANTILLDTANYNLLRSTPMSVDNPESILSAFQKQRQGVEVASWHRLSSADAAGTGPRAVAYFRSPEVLEFLMSHDYREESPEYSNFKYQINASARVGGVVIKYPLAISYMDGI